MTDQNSLAARDIAYHLHPFTNLKRHEEVGPLVITRGEGVRVFDDAGKEYIEGLAGLWCAALGFSEERLAKAAHAQMTRLPMYHGFAHKSHPPVIALAERLISLAPVPMSKVFFANSGSEANDTAVKLIWYYNNALGRPDKKKLITRQRAYHGVTLMSGSLTNLPILRAGFDTPLARVVETDCPHYYRYAQPGESEEAYSDRLAANLEALILAEGPDTVAAFFAEPVMGAGGVIVPPAGYFPKIQAVLKRYDILLVADEVICGFGRTGAMWGSQTFGIEPDLIATAKGLSSGYIPISALLVSEKVFAPIKERSGELGLFGHGFTYSGHPVATAVALEVLDIFKERDILGHVRRVGAHFQRRLQELGEHPLVGEARGVGLIGALETVRDKATKEPFAPVLGMGPRLMALAHKHGLITRAMGDALAFSPPLIITEEEVDTMFARAHAALDEAHAWACAEGLMARDS